MSERRFAILIGNSRYADPALPDLRCPGRDVQGLRKVLSSSQGGYQEVAVLSDAVHHQALREIHRTLKKAGRGDLVLIYFSGHGKVDLANRLHLCSADTEVGALEATSIPVQSIKNYIDVADTRKVSLILDCCYSGAVGGLFAKGGVDDQLQQVSGGRGVYVLSASTAVQAAMEKEGEDYSVFTRCLIEGLETGGADADGDGRITMDELYRYVHRRVLDEGAQEPMKWSVNVQGELIVAQAAGGPWKERRIQTRAILLDLAARGLLPDRVLTDALRHIGARSGPGVSVFDRILDEFREEKLSVGDFVEEWLAAASSAEGESRAESARPQGGRAGAEAPSFRGRPLTVGYRTAGEGGGSTPDRPPVREPPRTWTRVGAAVGSGAFALVLAPWRLVRSRVTKGLFLGTAGVTVAGMGVIMVISRLERDPPIVSVPGVEAPHFIDFEYGELPATYRGSWRPASDEAIGGWSLASPRIGHSRSASFALTPPDGVTSLSFHYRTDTESCCDRLHVWLNGTSLTPGGIVSQEEWNTQEHTFDPLPSWSVVEWEYRKDGTVHSGRDRVWVDNIYFGYDLDFVGGLEAPDFIDFEGGILPATFAGSWRPTTTQAAEGDWSLASPPTPHGSSSYFELVVPWGATGVIFSYRTDTEACCDVLWVTLEGVDLHTGGLVSPGVWGFYDFPLPPWAGGQTLRWEYRKDGSGSHGEDRVWVDAIEFLF